MSDGMLGSFQAKAENDPPIVETSFLLIYYPESENAHREIQIDVMVGSSLVPILGVGQKPYLDAIGLLQKAQRSGTALSGAAMHLLSTLSELYQDSLLQLAPTDMRNDRIGFYDKVWRLHMNFNRSISFAGQPATLRLVEPDFAKLEIHITLAVGGDETCRTLRRDDVEGDSYNLSHPRKKSAWGATLPGHWSNL